MPRVRQWNRQVGTNVQQVVGGSPEAFGAGQARAMQGLGGAIGDVAAMLHQHALEMQEREDARAVLEAENNFRRDMDELLHNKDTGLTTRTMSAAQGVTLDFDKAAQELRQKYLDQLGGKRQKEQFAADTDGYITAGREAMLKFETDQIRAGEDAALNDTLSANLAEVQKDPRLENVALWTNDSVQKLADHGKRRKLTPEQIAAQTEKLTGQMAAAAMSAALANNDLASAQEIWQSAQAQITAADGRAAIELKNQLQQAKAKEREISINLLCSQAAEVQSVDSLAGLVAQATGIVEAQARDVNLSEDATTVLQQRTVGNVIISAVDTVLTVEKDLAKAQQILDQYRDRLDGATLAKLQAAVTQAGFAGKLDSLWDTKYAAYTLEDGVTPDMRHILSDLEASGEFSGEDLVKARNYLEQRANETEAIRNTERNAKQSAVTDKVDQIFMNRGSKKAAEAVVRGAGFNPHDLLLNLRYIEELWRPASTQTPANAITYCQLYEGILLGAKGRNDIDAAFAAGGLSASEYKELFKMIVKKENGELTQAQLTEKQMTRDYIKRRAAELYPGDKKTQARFTEYFLWATDGKPYSQAVDLVEDGTKKVKTQWWDRPRAQWISDAETREQSETKWSRYYDLFTPEQVEWIKSSIGDMYEAQIVFASDLLSWEKDIGGELTPTLIKLIKGMVQAQIPVYPENIKALLKEYPTGSLPGTWSGTSGGW